MDFLEHSALKILNTAVSSAAEASVHQVMRRKNWSVDSYHLKTVVVREEIQLYLRNLILMLIILLHSLMTDSPALLEELLNRRGQGRSSYLNDSWNSFNFSKNLGNGMVQTIHNQSLISKYRLANNY